MHTESPDCIQSKGRFKGLPLHSACGYGKLEIVKKLVDWDPTQLEIPSVPVDLPAFTTTIEAREWDEVNMSVILVQLYNPFSV